MIDGTMKVSLTVSLLILAAGAAIGWRGRQQLASSLEHHTKVAAAAAAQGITLDPDHPNERIHTTKTSREDREAEAKRIASVLIAGFKEIEELRNQGPSAAETIPTQFRQLGELLMVLDADQVKPFIAELRAPELTETLRQSLLSFSVTRLVDKDPPTILAVCMESPDLLKPQIQAFTVSQAIAYWGKDDPMGAFKWLRDNREKSPDLISATTKLRLIDAVAGKNPKLALQFKEELGIEDSPQVARSIAHAARTTEQKTATLDALREWKGGSLGNNRESTANEIMAQLGRAIGTGGFERGAKWLKDTKLSAEELAALTKDLPSTVKPNEAGRWIEWFGNSTLPAETSREQIRKLAITWTEKDFPAAGAWLNSTPDSPVKQTVVCAYAERVFPYDRDTALQWVETVPAGAEREKSVARIYDIWPKESDSDKAAAKAFADRYGLKK